MTGSTALEAEVHALERMDLDGLRGEWRRRWGAAPTLRSVPFLRHMMAWRIQAAHLGGLHASLSQRLRKAPTKAVGPLLRPGMRIAREWKGVRYEVEVAETGFVHAGAVYASLSEIARTITGVRWNGPRFFGLRSEPAK